MDSKFCTAIQILNFRVSETSCPVGRVAFCFKTHICRGLPIPSLNSEFKTEFLFALIEYLENINTYLCPKPFFVRSEDYVKYCLHASIKCFFVTI